MFSNITRNSSLFAIYAQFLISPYLSTLGMFFLISSKIEYLIVLLGFLLGIFLYRNAEINLVDIFLNSILITLPINSKRLFVINDSAFLILLKDVRIYLFKILLSTTLLHFIPKMLSFVIAHDSSNILISHRLLLLARNVLELPSLNLSFYS